MGLSTHQLRNHFLQGIWLIGKSHLPTSTLLRGVDVSWEDGKFHPLAPDFAADSQQPRSDRTTGPRRLGPAALRGSIGMIWLLGIWQIMAMYRGFYGIPGWMGYNTVGHVLISSHMGGLIWGLSKCDVWWDTPKLTGAKRREWMGCWGLLGWWHY